jgi:hypothetical protein
VTRAKTLRAAIEHAIEQAEVGDAIIARDFERDSRR